MKIMLNEVEYTAPSPVTGLWFIIQKMKTEQGKRVEEIQAIWGKIAPFEGKELKDNDADALDKLMISCSKKTDINKQILLDTKIKIIVEAFKNENVTKDAILQYLPLQEVTAVFTSIDALLNDILSGRTAQLPNE